METPQPLFEGAPERDFQAGLDVNRETPAAHYERLKLEEKKAEEDLDRYDDSHLIDGARRRLEMAREMVRLYEQRHPEVVLPLPDLPDEEIDRWHGHETDDPHEDPHQNLH